MAHLSLSLRHQTMNSGTKRTRTRTFLQVLHRGGTPYNALAAYRVPETEIDFASDHQRAAFKQMFEADLDPKHFGQARPARDLPGETPKMRMMALAQSMVESRLFLADLSTLTPAQAEKARANLAEYLQDRGHHVTEDFQGPTGVVRCPTVHLREEPAGRRYLSCHPAEAEAVTHYCYGRMVPPKSVTFSPASPEVRLDFDPGVELDRFVQEAEQVPEGSVGRALNVVNHTPQPILQNTVGELQFSQPWLVSAERGIEMHLQHGNYQEVENLIPATNQKANDNGFLLYGHRGQTADICRRLCASGYLTVSKRWGRLPEIRAEDPTPVSHCDPLPFMRAQLPVENDLTARAVDRAQAFPLEPGFNLTPPQQIGVAWGSSFRRKGALIADAPGAGKSLMLAAAADLVAPKDSPILVVAPVGVLPHWVREVYDKIQIEGKGSQPPLQQEETARWMRYLGKAPGPGRSVGDLEAYTQIRHRYLFLPISTLECGLEPKDGDIVPRSGPGTDSTEQISARREILHAVSRSPVVGVLDEIQEFRRGGSKVATLKAILNGELGGREFLRVIAGSATPVHHDTADLGNYLALLKIPGFEDMTDLRFGKEFGERRRTYGRNGWALAPGSSVYDFTGYKSTRVGEVSDILSKVMLARDNETIFKGKSKPVRINIPLYQRDMKHGVQLPEVTVEGKLLPLPAEKHAEINTIQNPAQRAIALARCKVGTTVERAVEFLSDPKTAGQKIVLWTAWSESHREICEGLKARDINYHAVTGTPNEWKDHRGLIKPTKMALIDSFVAEPESRVLVATLGSAATGLDGLQYVVSKALVNDLPTTPGVLSQSLGRHARGLFRSDLPMPTWKEAVSEILMVDHPREKARAKTTFDRMHLAKFTRTQRLVGDLDSEANEVNTLCERQDFIRSFVKDGLCLDGQAHVSGASVCLNPADQTRLNEFRDDELERSAISLNEAEFDIDAPRVAIADKTATLADVVTISAAMISPPPITEARRGAKQLVQQLAEEIKVHPAESGGFGASS